MGALADRIRARLIDIESAIDRESTTVASRIASLESEREALEETLPLVTDRLEVAVVALQRLGFLKGL